MVRQGSRLGAWKAMPLIFSGPVTGWPSIRIRPIDGIFSPVVSFMKVDLPQPDGPTMAMNSPWRTFEVDRLDRKVVLGEQFFVVGEPDVLKVNEVGVAGHYFWAGAARSARPCSAGRTRSTPRRG